MGCSLRCPGPTRTAPGHRLSCFISVLLRRTVHVQLRQARGGEPAVQTTTDLPFGCRSDATLDHPCKPGNRSTLQSPSCVSHRMCPYALDESYVSRTHSGRKNRRVQGEILLAVNSRDIGTGRERKTDTLTPLRRRQYNVLHDQNGGNSLAALALLRLSPSLRFPHTTR